MVTLLTIVLFVVIIIGSFIIFKKSKTDKNKSNIEPQKHKEPVKKQYEEILLSLLKLNILLRKDKNLIKKIIIEVEAIIDDLIVTIPEMMQRYPGETLTYEIKKTGKEHLYRIVKEYLDLSLKSREQQLDVFMDTLENLHKISTRSREIVDNNEIAEFKTMANFLANKFE